jgi:hypothetical protein
LTEGDKKDPDSKNAPRYPSVDTINLNVSGHIELNVPKAESGKAERSSEQETYSHALKRDFFSKLRKVRFLAEIFTLIVLGIYTGINYCLYGATKDTERVSQRAYVNVQYITVLHGFVEDAPAEAIVFYQNTGHTPAKELSVAPMFDFIDNPLMTDPRPAPKHWLKCETTPQGGVLPPDVIRNVNAATAIGIRRAPTFTKKLYESILTNQKKWLVGAVIQYRDQFGSCHATSEVFWFNPASQEFDAAPYGFQQIDGD